MTTFQLFSKVGSLNGDAFCAVFRAMPFWSVVRSQSQRERFAAEQLGLRGFETFLPMAQTKRAAAPLFNGYFFVRIVEQWRSINFSFGVLGLVRVGDCLVEDAGCRDRRNQGDD
jgi:Transcription termination factor nusG